MTNILHAGGTGGTINIIPAADVSVLKIASMVFFLDFNYGPSLEFENGRISAITCRRSSLKFIRNSPNSAIGHSWDPIGADGQKGIQLASSHGVFYSPSDLWPAGSWTVMAIGQQPGSNNGYIVGTHDTADPVAHGYEGSNAMRFYTNFNGTFYAGTGGDNTGSVDCLASSYNTGSQTLRQWKNGTLLATNTSVAAPVHANRQVRIGGLRDGGSNFVGVWDGLINVVLGFSAAFADGDANMTTLKEFADGRFPSEGWAT